MKARPWNILFFLALALTPLHAAELSSTKGTVEIKKSGAAMWMNAKDKAAVSSGDVIRTGAGAAAEVKTAEGHRVTLKEKTTARVESAANGDSRFFLEVGKLRAKVQKLRRNSKFEVRTPVAVASVRGTVFEVDVAPDQTSKLFVEEGAVGYKELSGLSQEVLVPAGQEYTFTPPAAPDKTPPDGQGGTENKEKDPGETDEEKSKEQQKSEKEKERDERRAQKLEKEKQDEAEKEKYSKGDSDASKSEESRDDLKREILRETEMSLEKEFTQSEVVQDLKQEQSQEGRAMIDRLGRRVRFEEYLTRSPDNTSFSQRYLSHREGRTDEARFSVYARYELPRDLREVDLFRSKEEMKNWALATDWFVTNGDHYYRQWWVGGSPTPFTDPFTSAAWQQVVFNHGYEEFKGYDEPVLLSHWVPDVGFSNGNPYATINRDMDDVLGNSDSAGDGGQDIPTGYVNFDFNGQGVIGDDSPIKGYGAEKRLAFFEIQEIRDLYRDSEGLARSVQAAFDDKYASDVLRQGDQEGNRKILDEMAYYSGKRTLDALYFLPNGDKYAALRVDSYYVTDDGGEVLPWGKLGPSLSGYEGLHREEVYSSSLGKGDIDVIVGPSSYKQEEKERVPFVTLQSPR